jgi:hypothetical protein
LRNSLNTLLKAAGDGEWREEEGSRAIADEHA